LFRPVLDEMAAEIDDPESLRPRHATPSDLKETVHRARAANMTAQAREEIDRLSRAISLDETALADVARWEAAGRKVFEGFAFVDGRLWRESGEPYYILRDRHPEPAQLEVGFARQFLEEIANIVAASRSTGFSPGEWEAVAGHMAASGATVDGPPPISVLDEAVGGLDVSALEYDRLARMLVRDVGERMARNTRNSGEFYLAGVPSSVISQWAYLRDFVEAYDPFAAGVPEELEERVDAMLDALERHPTHKGKPFLHHLDTRKIESMRQRWNERRVGGDLRTLPTL
jgi:hypothetical protein